MKHEWPSKDTITLASGTYPKIITENNDIQIEIANRSDVPSKPIRLPLHGNRDIIASTLVNPDEYSVTVVAIHKNYIAIGILDDPYNLYYLIRYSDEEELVDIVDFTYDDKNKFNKKDQTPPKSKPYEQAPKFVIATMISYLETSSPEKKEEIIRLRKILETKPEDPTRWEKLQKIAEEFISNQGLAY